MATDVSEFIEVAIQGGLPVDTIYHAMAGSSAIRDKHVFDIGRTGLGNGTALRIVLTPFPTDEVMVSVQGWSAYPFTLGEDFLHWSYVAEKLTRGNVCDAVALTLLLGIALRRPVGVAGACQCPIHEGIVQ